MKKLVGFLFCIGFLLFSGTVEANNVSDAPDFGNVVCVDNTGDGYVFDATASATTEYNYVVSDVVFEIAELQVVIRIPSPSVIELYHNYRICSLYTTSKIPIRLQNGFSLLCELPPAKLDS